MRLLAAHISTSHRLSRVDVVGFAAILLLFGPGLLHFFTVSFSPDLAVDDSRQWTWPMLQYSDPSLFPEDPIADYYLNTLLPTGYHTLIRGLASVVDAVPLSTAVGHLSLMVALFFAFLTGRFLAGAMGGWICLALILANGNLLEWTAGGLTRSTGSPLAFMAMYGFLCNRRLCTGLATILGAMFWYPIAVSAGTLFAIQCLMPQALGWQESKPLAKRVAMVFVVACLALALSAPNVLFQSRWGAVVPNTATAWPETGPDGRFVLQDQLGLGMRPLDTARGALRAGFIINYNRPWLNFLPSYKDRLARAIVSLGLVVLIIMGWTRPIARRLLLVGAISIFLYLLAIVLAPMLYVPSRYVAVLIPWNNIFSYAYLGSEAGAWLSTRVSWVGKAQVQLLMAALAIFALGGRPFENGYDIRIDPSEREALNFISQLPKNVLTAGWPNGLVDNISLFSRRRVLLSRKTHVAFHETYMREMRPKAYAIIDAWFSADDRSLEFLRNHYGVSHFVIDKARRADRSLLYFEPFNQYILTKRADSEGKRRWIDAPPRQSVLFENEGYIITDLRRLASTDH